MIAQCKDEIKTVICTMGGHKMEEYLNRNMVQVYYSASNNHSKWNELDQSIFEVRKDDWKSSLGTLSVIFDSEMLSIYVEYSNSCVSFESIVVE